MSTEILGQTDKSGCSLCHVLSMPPLAHHFPERFPAARLCLLRVNIYLTTVAGQTHMIPLGWQDKASRGYTVS